VNEDLKRGMIEWFCRGGRERHTMKEMVDLFERWTREHCNSMSNMKERLEKLEERVRKAPLYHEKFVGAEGTNIIARLEKLEECVDLESAKLADTDRRVFGLHSRMDEHDSSMVEIRGRLDRAESAISFMKQIAHNHGDTGLLEKRLENLAERVGRIEAERYTQSEGLKERVERLESKGFPACEIKGTAVTMVNIGDLRERLDRLEDAHLWEGKKAIAHDVAPGECRCDARRREETAGMVVNLGKSGWYKSFWGYQTGEQMMEKLVCCIHCGRPIKRSLIG